MGIELENIHGFEQQTTRKKSTVGWTGLSASFFVLFFLLPGYLLSQNHKIEQLKQAFEVETDKKKVDTANELAGALYSYDFEAGFYYATYALELSQQIDYTLGKAMAQTSIGTYYFYKGEITESRRSYQRALIDSNEIKSDPFVAKIYLRLTILFRQQATFDSAQYFLKKAAAFLPKDKENKLHGGFYATSGILKNLMGQREDAISELKTAIRIRTAMADTVRLSDTYRNLGLVYTDLAQFDSAENCFRISEQLIAKIQDPEVVMLLYLSKGELYYLKGDIEAAIQHYNSAFEMLKQNTYRRYYARLLYKIGELYANQSDYSTAFLYLFDAVKEFEKINSKQNLAKAYTQIGWCYNFQNNYQLSIEHAKKSLRIASALEDWASYARNQDLIGNSLLHLGQSQRAMAYLDSAILLNNKNQIWRGVSFSLYNKALVHIQLEEPEAALEVLHQSIELSRAKGHTHVLVLASNEIGHLYLVNGDYTQALTHLTEAQRLAKQLPLPTQLLVNYRYFIDWSEQKNNAEDKIKYLNRYIELKDSLDLNNSRSRITEADALYQLQIKADEIQSILDENAVQKEKIGVQNKQIGEQQTMLLVVGVCLFVVIILLVNNFLLLKARNKSREKLKAQNKSIQEKTEEIQTQSEELQEANEYLEALNEQLSSKNKKVEKQKQKIKETNDNLELEVKIRTNQLSTAYNELETFFYSSSHDFRRPLTTYLGLVEIAKISVTDANALNLFEKVKETTLGLDRMLMKLQSISDISYVEQVEVFNSQDYIKEVMVQLDALLKAKNIRIDIAAVPMEVKAKLGLLKIVLFNLVENSINFCAGDGPSIRIDFYKKSEFLYLIVQDNGQGIAEGIRELVFGMYYRGNENSHGNGLGLYIVKKSVDRLEGTIHFDSVEKVQTTFEVKIPAIP